MGNEIFKCYVRFLDMPLTPLKRVMIEVRTFMYLPINSYNYRNVPVFNEPGVFCHTVEECHF